jgi:hypothetical protein
MKIRRRAFFNYLSETGMLNGTPEQIAIARLAYRQQYKRKWKQERKATKELRIAFTLEHCIAIKKYAVNCGLTQTAFVRNVILQAIGLERDVTKSADLLKALQLVSMAVNACMKDNCPITVSLDQAESLLLQYLNIL